MDHIFLSLVKKQIPSGRNSPPCASGQHECSNERRINQVDLSLTQFLAPIIESREINQYKYYDSIHVVGQKWCFRYSAGYAKAVVGFYLVCVGHAVSSTSQNIHTLWIAWVSIVQFTWINLHAQEFISQATLTTTMASFHPRVQCDAKINKTQIKSHHIETTGQHWFVFLQISSQNLETKKNIPLVNMSSLLPALSPTFNAGISQETTSHVWAPRNHANFTWAVFFDDLFGCENSPGCSRNLFLTGISNIPKKKQKKHIFGGEKQHPRNCLRYSIMKHIW